MEWRKKVVWAAILTLTKQKKKSSELLLPLEIETSVRQLTEKTPENLNRYVLGNGLVKNGQY